LRRLSTLNKSTSSAGDRESDIRSGQLGRDWGTGAFLNNITVELLPSGQEIDCGHA
jgi:hypothetical protein